MTFNFIKKLKSIVVTLRFCILSIFISLFISTSLLIIIITSIRFNHTLSSAAIQLMGSASSSVLRELTAGVKPIAVQSQFAANLIQHRILNANKPDFVLFTYYLVKNMPLALNAYWGDIHGNTIFSKKEPDGSISTDIYNRQVSPVTGIKLVRDKEGRIIQHVPILNLDYDPRTRPWFIATKKEKKSVWTDIYFFYHKPDRGISTASPVFKNNTFYGAFGADIDLSYLSEFTTKQIITPNGYSFIITNDGKLVAYPQREPFLNLNVLPNQFVYANSHSLPLIYTSFNEYKKSGEKKLTFSYNFKGKPYLVTYEPIPELAAYGWLIGVIVPESDFTSSLDRNNIITLTISIITLILGIILVSGLITKIVRPIKCLVRETENIKNFDLEGEVPVNSQIREVLYLKNAIREMKIGLKLFQRYIPKTLVRQLIESGENISVGGARKQLAIFFSDIENFTTVAEKTKPSEMMAQLCEYFEELSQIIFKETGTIDKYIGDSIMAFWGAPLPNDKPCHHAAYAAIQCQRKLDELNAEWKKQGKPQLITRIGIHTGYAIVGNMGSSERLNYTALGDTVNIASRLEGINKHYKTRIIVSEAFYEQVKDVFVLRMIDCVVVKGRTRSSWLYELLSDDIKNVPFDLAAYRPQFNQGFNAYKQQNWDEALASFEDCLKIFPLDTIAPIFIERCRHFKLNPPGPEWNGISVWDIVS